MAFSPRSWFFIGFVSCLSILLFAVFYFQLLSELEPCPLCISQRVVMIIVGVCFLIAALHNPGAKGIKIYAGLGLLLSLLGAAISTRHVWLQHLPPDQVPECGPGLEYVYNNFPLSETIKLLFNGTGDCAEVLWTFLGLSIPAWTFFAFLSFAGLSLYQFWNTGGTTHG